MSENDSLARIGGQVAEFLRLTAIRHRANYPTVHLRETESLSRAPGAGGGILDTTTPISEHLFAAWRRDLAGWGVPEEILAAAPEPPWTFPSRIFAERAERQAVQRAGPSYRRAEGAPPPGGAGLGVRSAAR